MGLIGKCPLTFTDAFAETSGNVWFLAAAEETHSTYDDGRYCGSAIGKMNADGEIKAIFRLDSPFKPEGIWVDDEAGNFFVVTDADDPEIPSGLYRGVLPNVT